MGKKPRLPDFVRLDSRGRLSLRGLGRTNASAPYVGVSGYDFFWRE
jgi:hypothetical protein